MLRTDLLTFGVTGAEFKIAGEILCIQWQWLRHIRDKGSDLAVSIKLYYNKINSE